MSQELGRAGEINVNMFCGPEGRRESYQLTGPTGYVQLTYEEVEAIFALVFGQHAKMEALRKVVGLE